MYTQLSGCALASVCAKVPETPVDHEDQGPLWVRQKQSRRVAEQARPRLLHGVFLLHSMHKYNACENPRTRALRLQVIRAPVDATQQAILFCGVAQKKHPCQPYPQKFATQAIEKPLRHGIAGVLSSQAYSPQYPGKARCQRPV